MNKVQSKVADILAISNRGEDMLIVDALNSGCLSPISMELWSREYRLLRYVLGLQSGVSSLNLMCYITRPGAPESTHRRMDLARMLKYDLARWRNDEL